MSTGVGAAVLAIDDLLTQATPEQVAALRAYVAANPTPLGDQVLAAARHTDEMMNSWAAEQGSRADLLPASIYPDWVRLGLLHALVAWLMGDPGAHTCPHSPSPNHPEPVFGAAWKPGLVICHLCGHLLQLPRNSAADRMCDGCGRVTEGVEAGDPVYPVQVAYGAFIYFMGCCQGCKFWPAEEGEAA